MKITWEDTQELLLVTDVLVSDYSSIMLDFSILKKPIFIYSLDVEHYMEIRGLKDIYFKMPVSHCKSNNELSTAIKSFDMNDYQLKMDNFLSLYGSFDHGDAAKKIVERIASIIG